MVNTEKPGYEPFDLSHLQNRMRQTVHLKTVWETHQKYRWCAAHRTTSTVREGRVEYHTAWHPALFHCWGIDSEQDKDGIMRWTEAIVEFEDGIVLKVGTGSIRFID